MYKEGHVGVVSKSGALSYEVGKTLTENGIGQSTVVAIGGGPFWGLTQLDIIKLFQEDYKTKIIVLLGEIGGTMEEETAEIIKEEIDKPVISLIVGQSAPSGKSLGHAGAIIQGNRGTARSKVEALRKAGSYIAKNPDEIIQIINKIGVL
jgi:succinyl-CoA synthetase alpha subunit